MHDGVIFHSHSLYCIPIFHSIPATVLVASTNEDLNASTTVFLSCVGFGLPVPELTWRRNQHKISTNTPHTEIRNDIILRGGQKFVRSTLILCNVTGELIGEYTCEAHNDMTSSEFTFMVTAPSMCLDNHSKLVSVPPK